ncbi:1527_t:CDS:1, partial [Gigaspora rosea]
MSFNEIYSKDTSEKYRPSSLQKTNTSTTLSTATTTSNLGINGMGFSSRAQFAANVHVLVKCIECNRPRVLYSQSRLSSEEEDLLKNFIETIDYTCGTIFYRISDLSKPGNNCNIDVADLQETKNGMNDDDNNINDMDDDKFVDELPTEQQCVNNGSLKVLFSCVFVNAKLTCLIPMEVPYFSFRLYPDVCFQCSEEEILSQHSPENSRIVLNIM